MVWDNAFSWINPKSLTYHLSLRSKEDIEKARKVGGWAGTGAGGRCGLWGCRADAVDACCACPPTLPPCHRHAQHTPTSPDAPRNIFSTCNSAPLPHARHCIVQIELARLAELRLRAATDARAARRAAREALISESEGRHADMLEHEHGARARLLVKQQGLKAIEAAFNAAQKGLEAVHDEARARRATLDRAALCQRVCLRGLGLRPSELIRAPSRHPPASTSVRPFAPINLPAQAEMAEQLAELLKDKLTKLLEEEANDSDDNALDSVE